MTKIITSQHFLNDEIIAAKRSAHDFEVLVSPAFEVEGETYRVILDGHHSFAAALEAGCEPDLSEASATQHDAVALLDGGQVETFLEAVWMDGDYIDAVTRGSTF